VCCKSVHTADSMKVTQATVPSHRKLNRQQHSKAATNAGATTTTAATAINTDAVTAYSDDSTSASCYNSDVTEMTVTNDLQLCEFDATDSTDQQSSTSTSTLATTGALYLEVDKTVLFKNAYQHNSACSSGMHMII
jgi:hypothetical protein